MENEVSHNQNIMQCTVATFILKGYKFTILCSLMIYLLNVIISSKMNNLSHPGHDTIKENRIRITIVY